MTEKTKPIEDVYKILQEPFSTDAYAERTAGGRKLTSIDAYHIVDRMNKVFGLCGYGWGFKDLQFIHDNQSQSVVCIGVIWYKLDIVGEVHAVGDAQYFSRDKNGNPKTYSLAEAYKKAQTNLLSKGASFIGIGLDVFMGKFDSDPYNNHQPIPPYSPSGNTTPVTAGLPDDMIDGLAASTNDEDIPDFMGTPTPMSQQKPKAAVQFQANGRTPVNYKLPWNLPDGRKASDVAKQYKCRFDGTTKFWSSLQLIPEFSAYIVSH